MVDIGIALFLLVSVCLVIGYGAGYLGRLKSDRHNRKKEKAFMSDARDALTVLESKITDAETIREGVTTLVEGLVAEVQKLAAEIKDQPTAKELLSLASRVQAMTTSYSTAVLANTPGTATTEPAPTPAPTPAPAPAPPPQGTGTTEPAPAPIPPPAPTEPVLPADPNVTFSGVTPPPAPTPPAATPTDPAAVASTDPNAGSGSTPGA